MKKTQKYFNKIMILLLILFLSCCEDNYNENEYNDEVNKAREKRSKEVRDSLTGEIVFYKNCCSINKVLAKYGGSGIVLKDGAAYLGPKWSPDGSRIAFIKLVSDLQTSASYWYLTLVNRVSLEQKDWMLDTSSQIINIRNITWSYDGNYIAVLLDSNVIMYVESETGEITTTELISGSNEYYLSLAWKPASNKIAVSLRTGDIWSGNIKNSIWLFDAFSNNPQENQDNLLVTTSVNSTIEHMDWSFDGSMLTYSEYGVSGHIYVVNANGSENRELKLKGIYAGEKLFGYAPCWASNNNQIVFCGITDWDYFDIDCGLLVTDITGSYVVDLKIPGELPDWY